MKPIEAGGETLTYLLNHQERFILRQVLDMYPMVPASYHRVTHSPGAASLAESQRLLDEALAEQRLAAKNRVNQMFQEGQCLRPAAEGHHLTLTKTHRECLLQVLNDIRVGCWLELGCPEDHQREALQKTKRSLRFLMAMDFCAYFQYGLISGGQGEREMGHGLETQI